MSAVRLESVYEAASQKLAHPDGVEFRADEFDPPPRELVTKNLILHRSVRNYMGFDSQQVYFLAQKAVFQRLALVMIAAQFHDRREGQPIRIRVEHPNSDLGFLFIDDINLNFARVGDFRGRVKLETFSWFFRTIDRLPWCRGELPDDPWALPQFNLADTEVGDTLGFRPAVGAILQGRRDGQARLIDLLLAIGHPENGGTEFVLEGESGFRGVAPASIEAGFVLPGSVLFDAWGSDL